jgi:hypothetical protein
VGASTASHGFSVWDQYDRPPLAGLPWTRACSLDVKAGLNSPTGFEKTKPKFFSSQFKAMPGFMAKWLLPGDPLTAWKEDPAALKSGINGWAGALGWAGFIHRPVSVKEEAREVEEGITVPDAKNRVKEEEVVVV